MNISEELSRQLPDIIDLANLAPSVHNTQPWRVSLQGKTIVVELNPKRLLKDGDPTGRETIISLGIFAEAIALVAKDTGFATLSVSVTNDREAVVEFNDTQLPAGASPSIDLLRSRTTDRSIYKPAAIGAETSRVIEAASQSDRIKVWVRSDRAFIEKIAELTAKGIRVALTSPGFRNELSRYLVLPFSRKTRGIATRSLYIPLLFALAEPWMLRFGVGLNKEAALEKRRWRSASGVVCITSEGDMQEDWFAVGKTYLHVALAIEAQGLSQATSAATVEASTFHEDIENMLDTKQRLQSTIRIGKGKKRRARSPRVPANTLIVTSN